MSAVIADIRIALGNSSFVPQCVNSTSDPCCGLHEWPVFLLRGGTKYVALAAFPALRAHAAQITNLQIGLEGAIRCDCERCSVKFHMPMAAMRTLRTLVYVRSMSAIEKRVPERLQF